MRQFKPGQLQSGSLYPITASFALTASYLSGSISINTGSLVTTASFNAFTASYTTGSFTGSFRGDGSQLTGIVSSKWTGSNPISRQSDVEITGSFRVSGSANISNQLTANTLAIQTTSPYTATLISNGLTGSNNYYFPNKQGTLALREDLPNAGSGLTQIIATPDTFKLGGNITENTIFTDDTNTYNISINGPNIYLFKADSNAAPTIRLNRASGSASTPYPPPSNSYLGVISAGGYDNGVLAGSAALIFQASENFTSSARGTELFFNTTPNGTNIPIRRLTIKNDGTVIITGSLDVTGSLNVTGSSVVLNTGDFRVYDPVSINNLLEITSLSGVQIASTDGQRSTDFETRTNLDSLNIDSIDWENRHLIQSDGATVTLDWETGALTGSLQGTASFAETASYVNTLRQQVLVSGSFKLDPTQDTDPAGLDLDSTVFFQSSSNTALGYDLYVRQNGNLVKWKWIEGILETGLLYGGVVTYSGSNVFISPGSGIIADHNAVTGSEVSPMIEYVTWNAITQSITNIASQQVTYLYIDNNGALQQQSTTFTAQQYHDYIPLGAAGHFDYTQVSAFGGAVQTAHDQVSQMSNFVDAFGPLKVSGYGITGQPGSLQLSVGSGISFIRGGFYENDPEFPSQITTPSVPTASFAYLYRSGSGVRFDTNGGNFYTSLRPQFYDPGTGVTGSVSNNDWTIQRLYSDPNTGILYAYYGQTIYPDYLTAVAALSTDLFTEGATFAFTTFIGFLILRSNTADITDTIDNKIVPAGLFRGSGQGSGGGIAISNLDDLTDVSIISPTNGQALIYDTGVWKNGTPISSSFAVSASRAVTASLALTASFVTPLIQNVIVTGSLAVTQNITGSRMFLSASSNMNSGPTLTVYGSGSTQPVFTVQGSSGELFSITDSLTGSLFSVNDISGLPILEVFSDNTTLIGNYLDPMLITTAKVTQTNSSSFVVYSLPTASYDTAFFEYSVKSGSNARAGTIMAIQSGSSVNFTETTTLDFGSTTAISFTVVVTGSNMALTGSSTTGAWTIKSIVRGI